MEKETVDRIERIARGFAVVLVALLGAQTLCEDMGELMGPFITLVALIAVALSWHADVLRACLWRHPRVFVALAATCVAAMTLAFVVAARVHGTAMPTTGLFPLQG